MEELCSILSKFVGGYPYKNYKVALACDMVVTSLNTRNMLATTLFPGYDDLVKPSDKLVSLHKVVTTL